nr:immunoglobulin light chain junction region [Macaca mulatta]
DYSCQSYDNRLSTYIF